MSEQLKVLTANDLEGGQAVFRTETGWSDRYADARIYDDAPAADAALFAAIRSAWKPAPNRQLIAVDAHINDPAFAEAAVHAFRDITRGQ